MKTTESIKREKISHLNFVLEKLLLKETVDNELEISYLYRIIYDVVCEMEDMNSMSALKYYDEKINDETRKMLLKFNIKLLV